MLHAFTDHRGQANCMSRSFRCFFPIMFVTRIARTFLFSSDPASVGKRLAAKGNQARACRSSNTVFIGWRLAETETERGLIWPRPTGAVLVTLILGRRVVYVTVAIKSLSTDARSEERNGCGNLHAQQYWISPLSILSRWCQNTGI